MNRYALAAMLGLLSSGAVQAAIVDLGSVHATRVPHVADLSTVQRHDLVAPPATMSELPEPEVLAMMLMGVVLIGYRARRDSSDKFE